MKRGLFVILMISVLGCQDRKLTETEKEEYADKGSVTVETAVGDLTLEAPFTSESVTNQSKIVDWPEGVTPKAPEGFVVTRFAENLDHPRWTYIAPNKDIFVAESNTKKSANRITLLRDNDGDGNVDEQHVFLENLNQNFGMLVLDGFFYVANTDGLYRYPYKEGDTNLTSEGEKIVALSASGYNNHWTRNIIASKDKDKIYISVGSASNAGEQGMEKEERRANILQINPDGSGEITYASGLRNPVGMDFNPVTGELWTAVNERDKLGDNLVPDYITSVKEGGWYGWPYSYYGQVKDPRWKDDPHEEMVAKAIVPDVPVGNHTASLGIAFYNADRFPEKYKNGAFVGQHGSWNRAKLSGYKVLFVPFENGKPTKAEDFLTGFIANEEKSEVFGRPVCVVVAPDGSLLVNDDDGGIIWKVSPKSTESTE
ncbi:PQQ-dependent sugar dehydrogenase [Cyclobacterium qasimii]|uniref:L-sorbosone dehydrogenase n=2 Tax=Cyclobacterium qasimii TaxID=1350429 RepID=S7X5H4_9BACT|nr:sorbosone dehydrogenase family protein [Cyclobacterium qasimii]EPR71333.1 L-sorbosone dehydrogenase [Cyclobacterium qasimii M12-11B]GEO20514.1 sorbosone dehydrogenase [Cyclobacterium qasimii]